MTASVVLLWVTSVLAAAPLSVCVERPDDLSDATGPAFIAALEQRLKQPVLVNPSHCRDVLELKREGDAVLIQFSRFPRGRLMPLDEAIASPEGLALLAAGLIADESLPPSTIDVSALPKTDHEHLWVYAGAGAALSSGLLSPVFHLGTAWRFEDVAVGAEVTQALAPLSMLHAMVWYGRDVKAFRFDGGAGLGLVAESFAASGAVGASTKFAGRARYAFSKWFDVNLRFEFCLTSSLSSARPPSSSAALQLGFEVRIGTSN